MTVVELSEKLRRRELSSVEVTEQYLSAIQRGSENAYITVTDSMARSCASRADAMRSLGECHALCGIPFSVKDNIALANTPMTCASRMLADFVPPYSATVCEDLLNVGAVVLGKTNMDEFAMGSSSEKSLFGAVRNPLDLTRSAGGSSGGAAASVAAGQAAFALGSDTGGSARQPAAFCGLVSMKPTYGLVSRYGLVEVASSLEQICPITRTVRDNALVLSVLCGRDARDMTTIDFGDGPLWQENPSIRGLKIGVFADFASHCRPGVARCVLRGAEKLATLGGALEEVTLPSPELARDIYLVTMAAEASSNLARYDGIRYGGVGGGEDPTAIRSDGFGEEVRRRVIAGTYALSSVYRGDYYRKIKNAGRELCRRMEEIFLMYDMILMPTVGTVPFCLGAFDDTPTELYNSDCFTVYANLTGCPAITVPCGGEGGLPVGLMLMGRKCSEVMLYGAAALLEQSLREELKAELRLAPNDPVGCA